LGRVLAPPPRPRARTGGRRLVADPASSLLSRAARLSGAAGGRGRHVDPLRSGADGMTGALVVGGAGAIGAASAEALVDSGWSVVVADLDGVAARQVAEGIGAVGALEVDVTSAESVQGATDEAVAVVGRLGAAVNLAAVGGPVARVHEYDDSQWSRMVEVNL